MVTKLMNSNTYSYSHVIIITVYQICSKSIYIYIYIYMHGYKLMNNNNNIISLLWFFPRYITRETQHQAPMSIFLKKQKKPTSINLGKKIIVKQQPTHEQGRWLGLHI